MNKQPRHPRTFEEFVARSISQSIQFGTYVIDLEIFDPQSLPSLYPGLPAPEAPAVACQAISYPQHPKIKLETPPSCGPRTKPVPQKFQPTIARKTISAKIKLEPSPVHSAARQISFTAPYTEETRSKAKFWYKKTHRTKPTARISTAPRPYKPVRPNLFPSSPPTPEPLIATVTTRFSSLLTAPTPRTLPRRVLPSSRYLPLKYNPWPECDV